jgi:glycosyltransferase involved in cell wall biosynthesis
VRRVHVHLVHPGDPFAVEPDGIVSVQRNFVAAAPEGFVFDYWGVSRRGVTVPPDGVPRFHPLLAASEPRPRVPVSLSFGLRLAGRRRAVGPGVLRFDRIESALPFLGVRSPKTIFLHTWNARDNRDPGSESRWRRLSPAYDALFSRVIRSMELVYVLRPDMAEDLRTRMPGLAARIRRFEVPVDLETFRPLDRRGIREVRRELASSSGVPEDARLVVFAGRLEGQKRPLVIPEVIARLRRSMADPPHAVVVGAGSLERALRAAAEGTAPGLVHVLSPMPQAELSRVMAVADASLLPSAFEGLPNVVLESLACGTPVVAARAPGRVAEIIIDPRLGSVVDPGADALAAGIRAALEATGDGRPAEDAASFRRSVAGRFGAAALNGPIYAEFEGLARLT